MQRDCGVKKNGCHLVQRITCKPVSVKSATRSRVLSAWTNTTGKKNEEQTCGERENDLRQ